MDLSEPIEQKATVLYLHGFASGPQSTKARFFQEKLEQSGYTVCLPDLNVPNFHDMTLSAQLHFLDELQGSESLRGRPLILMGSSLGGLLATIASSRLKSVQGMILLAPGFGITERWRQLIGEDELARWRDSGVRKYFHYACKAELELSYQFIADLEKHATDDLVVNVPTLVFHGIEDQTVPLEGSRRFKKRNGNRVQLEELNDGHELIASLPVIWPACQKFFADRGF